MHGNKRDIERFKIIFFDHCIKTLFETGLHVHIDIVVRRQVLYLKCTTIEFERSYHDYIIGYITQLNTKKVNFLVLQQYFLNFAAFFSNFINTYVLLNFIHY